MSEDAKVDPVRVLVVDDDEEARSALVTWLSRHGMEVAEAADGRAALARLAFEPDVVLTDLQMPELDGLGLIREAHPRIPHCAFVVMTAFGEIETAAEAIRIGATHYLSKPLDLEAIVPLLERTASRGRLLREAEEIRRELAWRRGRRRILGDHPTMQRLMRMVEQVADTRATVLIQGESGTGKELIARAIHEGSPRAGQPFVMLNCASLSAGVLESELFGHEKGAFTGADRLHVGKLEQADGGTLFLDEVSEIPLSTQVKLLRFLQEREIQRVGGNDTLLVDVRVVAASNRDLAELVHQERFREDLFYRLHVVDLRVPALRERPSDVPLLAVHFLDRFRAENARAISGFSDEAVRRLRDYAWPGNVRELENVVERAVVLCREGTIGVEHLPAAVAAAESDHLDATTLIPGISLANLEKIAILRTLEACDGSPKRAAEILGISRRKIHYRLQEWRKDGSLPDGTYSDDDDE
ncbi:MAG: sigma-54-dependent transcriptional regulator [Sandaracinaceae bacterium]